MVVVTFRLPAAVLLRSRSLALNLPRSVPRVRVEEALPPLILCTVALESECFGAALLSFQKAPSFHRVERPTWPLLFLSPPRRCEELDIDPDM